MNTAARVESAGHAGQILITGPVRSASNAVDTRDLEEHLLKDVPDRVRLYEIGDGDFPPLRTGGGAGTNGDARCMRR